MVGLKILSSDQRELQPEGIYMSRSDRSGTGRQANFYLYLYIYISMITDGVVTPSVLVITYLTQQPCVAVKGGIIPENGQRRV